MSENIDGIYPMAVNRDPDGCYVWIDDSFFSREFQRWVKVTSTTIAANISTGSQTVTPASMAGIWVGVTLSIGPPGTVENVTVTAVTQTTFTATFANTHTGPGIAVTGVVASGRYPGTWYELDGYTGTFTQDQSIDANNWIADPNSTVLIAGTFYRAVLIDKLASDGIQVAEIIPGNTTSSSATITVEDVDSVPQYTGITTLRFDQADGFVLSNPSAGVARIDFTFGGITVKNLASFGTPLTIANVTIIQIDFPDTSPGTPSGNDNIYAITLTNPSAGIAQFGLSIEFASFTTAGLIYYGFQEIFGAKDFYGGGIRAVFDTPVNTYTSVGLGQVAPGEDFVSGGESGGRPCLEYQYNLDSTLNAFRARWVANTGPGVCLYGKLFNRQELTSIVLADGGSGYAINDTLTFDTDVTDAIITVDTVDGGGAILTFTLTQVGLSSTLSGSYTNVPADSTSGSGIDALFDMTWSSITVYLNVPYATMDVDEVANTYVIRPGLTGTLGFGAVATNGIITNLGTGGITTLDAGGTSADLSATGPGVVRQAATGDPLTVYQSSSTGETTGFTAGAGTAVNDDSTFTGNVGATAYTIGDIVKALKGAKLLAD